MRLKKAFTMAEAILVMTILGVIATIMISTLKPAQYKEQAFQVLSKSIYAEIDSAMTQIMSNHTQYNALDGIYELGTTAVFNMAQNDEGPKLITLFKKYMSTSRGDIPDVCMKAEDTNPGVDYGEGSAMLLKNGACIAISSGNQNSLDSWIPGENRVTTGNYSHGVIFLDINGDSDPNVLGKDEFFIPLVSGGITSGDEEALGLATDEIVNPTGGNMPEENPCPEGYTYSDNKCWQGICYKELDENGNLKNQAFNCSGGGGGGH